MKVTVTTQYRRGRRVAKWQSHRPGIQGKLNIKDMFDAELSRYRVTAWLSDDGGNNLEDPPPLFDATVIYLDAEGMVLVGTERLPDESIGVTPTDYAQEWYVRYVNPSS